jgi:hypothetical protein
MTQRMKRAATLVLAAISVILVLTDSSCDDQTTADKRDSDTTARQYDIYTQSQPVHTYNFSMPRDVMLQIYDATMEAHNTWTVWYAFDHTPLDSCPSIGYPIPGGTQLTNPMRATNPGSNGALALPQGEPNGLFPPSTSGGTWVLCVRGGKTEPTYVEPNVVTYAHPVGVRDGRVVDLGGDSTITVQVRNSTQTTPAPGAATKVP